MTTTSMTPGTPGTPATRYDEAAIEADPTVPAIHIRRDFRGTVDQLMRAHLDPDLVGKWMGPTSRGFEVDHWDARTGGSWRYVSPDLEGDAGSEAFRGCFHEVGEDRIVQTFTWEGMPEDVSLETVTFTDLGDGRTRLHAFSLCDSFEGRDAWLRSGMEVGVTEGYAALQELLSASSEEVAR